MTKIEEIFAEHFARWAIRLPIDAVLNRERGVIQEQGWHIQYLFGKDERGSYLDYFASHRMTNDRHVRIYETGEIDSLPVYEEFMTFPDGASEAEKERIRKAYYENNQRVTELLKAKGFI